MWAWQLKKTARQWSSSCKSMRATSGSTFQLNTNFSSLLKISSATSRNLRKTKNILRRTKSNKWKNWGRTSSPWESSWPSRKKPLKIMQPRYRSWSKKRLKLEYKWLLKNKSTIVSSPISTVRSICFKPLLIKTIRRSCTRLKTPS